MLAVFPRIDRPLPIAAMVRWWSGWTWGRRDRAEPGSRDRHDAERLAQDVGLPAADLRAQASQEPEDTELLRRRMVVLGLDPDDVARTEPWMFRDLQRLCTMCECPRQCAHDLADNSADPTWQNWRDYCPNATTLSMLSALNAAVGKKSSEG